MDYLISINNDVRGQVIQLGAYLREWMAKLLEQNAHSHMKEKTIGNRHFFICHWKRKNRFQDKEFRKRLGSAIADFICDSMESMIIKQIIGEEHPFFDRAEMLNIEGRVIHLLESSVWEYAKVVYAHRREKLARQITAYLKENSSMAVDGFVQFRMKTYRRALAVCVDEAVQEYWLDREYREFIEWLRYFVSLESSKLPIVHVFHKGKGRFRLVDDEGVPLSDSKGNWDGDSSFMSWTEEDQVVGALLHWVPKQIVIHTQNKEENVIRTLMQIFEDRVILCENCHSCAVSLSFRQSLD